ncbi:MAG: hypothetical protein JRN68_07050 [Nitrososphaerota archaeon]|jgi:hypothetical protein|nr:hypothetical protein [Nitrososphaerota archaeon]
MKIKLAKSDNALQSALTWAIERMNKAGYRIDGKVKLVVDSSLEFMGYAEEKRGVHYIVASEWALDSEMLGGFLFHELSHIYSTERALPSHDLGMVESYLARYKEVEGLSERETAYLLESFSHLQNIIVDDIVFDVMNDREKKLVQKFFESWITNRPTGDPIYDASSLVRNAFAISSLKRRNMLDPQGHMARSNEEFLAGVSRGLRSRQNELISFFENFNPNLIKRDFMAELARFFDLLLTIVREKPQFEDMK